MPDVVLPDDGRIRVDTDARRVWVGARKLHLGPQRYRLLAALHANAGKVMSLDHLAQQVWDSTWRCAPALRTQIFHLRDALGSAPDGGQYIATVRWVGYQLEAQWAAPLDAGDTVTVARADLEQALEHLDFSCQLLADGKGEYNPPYRGRLRAALEEAGR